MRLTITLTSDNDAFSDGTGGRKETARILRELAERIASGLDGTLRLYDANGNVVGAAYVEPGHY